MKLDNKIFYKSVFMLVIPIALQNLINVGVQIADVLMLGMVNEVVLSGASLAGQFGFVFNLIIFGLTSGAAVLASQYWGKCDTKSIEKIMGIALRLSLCVGVLFLAVSLLFPANIMRLFSSEEAVIIEGVKYLRIVCFSYIFTSFSMVYLNIMRSVEKVIIATVVYSSSLIINIILNLIFIFGLLGFPAMGISGAALATLIARIIEVIIVLIYDRKINKIIRLRLKTLFSRNKLLFGDFLKYSVPVVINELLWGAAMAVSAGILGHLGSAAAAASSVAQVTRQLAMVGSFGVASATAIMLGKVIGENNIGMAKIYAKKFMKLSVYSGLLGALAVFIAGPIVINVMNLSKTATEYLTLMMLVMTYYVFLQSITCTAIVGVFRAGGDTKMGLVVDVSTMWFGSIILGLLSAFVFKFSVPVVFILLLSDELLKLPIVIWRYKSYKWLNNVTR